MPVDPFWNGGSGSPCWHLNHGCALTRLWLYIIICILWLYLPTDAIQDVTFKANTVEQAVSISFNCIEKNSVFQAVRSHPPLKPLVKQSSNYRLHLSLKEPEGILKSAHSKSSIKHTGKNSPKKKLLLCFFCFGRPLLEAAAKKKDTWNKSKSFKPTCSQLRSRRNMKLMQYF